MSILSWVTYYWFHIKIYISQNGRSCDFENMLLTELDNHYVMYKYLLNVDGVMLLTFK